MNTVVWLESGKVPAEGVTVSQAPPLVVLPAALHEPAGPENAMLCRLTRFTAVPAWYVKVSVAGAAAAVPPPGFPPPPTTRLTGTAVDCEPTVIWSDPLYVLADNPDGLAKTTICVELPAESDCPMVLPPKLSQLPGELLADTDRVPAVPVLLVMVMLVCCWVPLRAELKETGLGLMPMPLLPPPLIDRFTVIVLSVMPGLLELASETMHW